MMQFDFLSQSVEYARGVGPVKGDVLKKELGIFTFGDLLTYYPYRYVDRSRFHTVSEIREEGLWVQLTGRIIGIQVHGEKRKSRLTVLFADQTGSMELVWFQGLKWIMDRLEKGREYVIFGRTSKFGNRFNLPHPEVELLSDFKSAPHDKFQPLYNTTEKMKNKGLDSRGVSRIIKVLMHQAAGSIPETLPDWLVRNQKLYSLEDALRHIHFPESLEQLDYARFRLKYEELLLIQLHLLSLKRNRYDKIAGYQFTVVGDLLHQFYEKNLPFELTNAQKRVVRELRQDMGSGHQMNRLLQGDVGSGKTLVALMAALIAIGNGYQVAIMAPTEILANQHFNTINKFLLNLPVKVDILTGSAKSKRRKKLLEDLRNGEINILIGTHALIEDKVVFTRLGLAVIDEQHRFGVEQRAKLWSKSEILPHVLVMTATPIPRTLAMTLYGDLDYSVIDEMPPGRKPVKTIHQLDSKRLNVFSFVKQQIDAGRQVYFVYPLIEESEKLDLKDLMDGFESITRAFPLPEYAVSIVHGRMNPEDKDYEMDRFVRGETNIMVSTTVIEVGVDVPNASVMVIESAERFGLSQLHQLRGRVGRGADQSYCILMTDVKLTAEARTRINTMVSTTDGFEIADVDLSLRGPGDMQGTRQSGMPDLKIADLGKDDKILRQARDMANLILERDPGLKHEANLRFQQALRNKFREAAIYAMVG
ncbi:MAG: ATP-dependent DNA helicase RecG [Bacteroidales bacterium]